MSFYPEKISERFYAARRAGRIDGPSAVGTGVSFLCGTFVRYFFGIDGESGEIRDARYKSNGCGYAVAAAEVLAESLVGKKLTELHGLGDDELKTAVEAALGEFPAERAHCAALCFEALHAALDDYRSRRLEEFTGEKALVCTCFGVAEDEVENAIAETGAETVEEVTAVCQAGGGCGSCRMLIEEMIDIHHYENP